MREYNLDKETKIWLKQKKYNKYRFHLRSGHIHDLWITHDDLKIEILKILKNKIITIEDFQNHFLTPILELNSYLDSFEKALFIKEVNGGWVLTSRGISYLRNYKSKNESLIKIMRA